MSQNSSNVIYGYKEGYGKCIEKILCSRNNIIIDNILKEKFCEIERNIVDYKDIFEKNNKRDKYEAISPANNVNGIYLFYKKVENEIEVLYVGANYEKNEKRDLSYRIKQHFRPRDTGGLMYKLAKNNNTTGEKEMKKFINKGVKLTYFTIEKSKQEILFIESYLIGALCPKYNFLNK